jgi:hypothetical protein
MSAPARRQARQRRAVTFLLVSGLVFPLGLPAARATRDDREQLSSVQRKLEAVTRVLADARADSDTVARALVQADRDVSAARADLEAARHRYRLAQARRRAAMLQAARAKLEVDAQQAVIDRRARAAYITPSAVGLTLLVDATNLGDLLDRGKLLDNVATAANHELTALVAAKARADQAEQRARAAERDALQERARMQQRAVELAQVRAARAAAKAALDRKVAALQIRTRSLRSASVRIARKIAAEEAARRAAAEAARRARLARQARLARASGPTVIGDDHAGGGYGGGPDTASYRNLTPSAKRLYGLVERIFDVHAIGGWRPYGSVPNSDHPRGQAIDVMVPYPGAAGNALGWRIATWASGNAWALNVKYVIFNGRIWTPGRGWHAYRHPSDPCNCNPTLRHDDHVHISVRS